MKKTRKQKCHRIMVSMPPAMFADFKEKAEQSGLSMSRVIYLRLKTKGSMILVPQSILKGVQQLVRLHERILATGVLSEEDRQLLLRIIDFEMKMVAFDTKTTVIHGKEVK